MWIYQKRLQYPIKIKSSNPALAKIIASQYGGPHGEIGASLRYLSQRYVMPYPELKAILTDVGTEELAHMEMVGTIVYQLTRNLTPEQIKAAGYDAYFVDHTTGIYPVDASGNPFSALALDSTGDTLADIHEDLAAEQKARMTYDNILRFCTDEPEVRDVIRFLRAREVVHYQRFGEGLRIITDNLNDRNFYAYNPAFDRGGGNVLGSRAQKVNSRVSGQT
ncbi:MAG TPA: rubrerythrin family protein, partial [Ruminococcaceae bacterium]|nr:rubrerythrin family protein [Oscillospiraceae bacterium]